jgi:Fur family ferric uptake transcriptional regulator
MSNARTAADGRSLTPSLPGVPITQSPVNKFREFLDLRRLKVTSERLRIVAFIFEEHQHFEAEQLLDSMKAKGVAASRPTVYRTLSLLVEAGLLRKLALGGVTAYEHDYGYPRHEHLYCEKCGGVIEFVSEDLDRLLENIARQHRFRPMSRKLVIQGICENCSKASSPRRKLDMI